MTKVFRKLWAGWKMFARKVARFQTNVLLTFFYFIIFVPLGLIYRLFGWDPLESRRGNLRKDTNWKAPAYGELNQETLRRQS
jgi:hypothetical protein